MNRYYLVIGPRWDASVIAIHLQQRQQSINTFNPLRVFLIGLAMIAKGVASVLKIKCNQIDDVIIRRGRAKESGSCARALRFSRGMLSNDPVASYCRALPCSLSHTPDVPSPFVVHVFFHFLSRLNNRGYASWRSCTYPCMASFSIYMYNFKMLAMVSRTKLLVACRISDFHVFNSFCFAHVRLLLLFGTRVQVRFSVLAR